MKKALFFIPEFLLIILAVYWFLDGFLTTGSINYIALSLIAFLVFQLFYKNKIIGYILASIILILSLYMVFAVLSEFHEFKAVNNQAIKLLTFGFTMCLLMFVSSVTMFYNYFKLKK